MSSFVTLPAGEWKLISDISTVFQPLNNDVRVCDNVGVPVSENLPANVCLVNEMYVFDKVEGDLYGYSEQGAKIVVGLNIGKSGGDFKPSGESINVNVVENSKPSIEHFLWEELNDVVIASVTANGKTVNLEPGHGFLNPSGLDADYLNIHYVDPLDPSFVGVRFSQHKVLSVVGDVVEITVPLGYALNPVNVEFSKRVNVNMSVLGTRAAPISFQTYPPNGQIWDIRRFIPDMILSTAGDDGLFGNIAPLVYGEYFGFENPVFKSYGLAYFDNGDIRSSGYDLVYVPRSGGGGTHGLGARKTFSGPEKSGVVIKLDGATNDRAVKFSQDDLTGINRYRIRVMGDISNDSDL